jgi:hypothetical protein
MPSEYFYESSWTYKLEEAKDWLADLFSNIFYKLLYIAAFVYSFILHNALIRKRNYEGFFLFAITPFLALPFLKEIRQFLPFHTEKWEAWLYGSLSISLIFTAVILIYSLMEKNRRDDNANFKSVLKDIELVLPANNIIGVGLNLTMPNEVIIKSTVMDLYRNFDHYNFTQEDFISVYIDCR